MVPQTQIWKRGLGPSSDPVYACLNPENTGQSLGYPVQIMIYY
jgi:hypothetical protein